MSAEILFSTIVRRLKNYRDFEILRDEVMKVYRVWDSDIEVTVADISVENDTVNIRILEYCRWRVITTILQTVRDVALQNNCDVEYIFYNKNLTNSGIIVRFIPKCIGP